MPALQFAPSNCKTYEAPASNTLVLHWTSCGTSCEETDPTFGLGTAVVAFASSVVEGAALGAWTHYTELQGKRRHISRVVRLKDGVVLSTLTTEYVRATCERSLEEQSANSFRLTAGPEDAPLEVHGVFVPSRGWTWASEARPRTETPPGRSYFASDSSIFYTGESGAFVETPPAIAWQSIKGGDTSSFGAAYGNAAIWAQRNSTGIRQWDGIETSASTLLESAPGTTCMLALSAQNVVGLAASECGGTDGIRFWSVARTAKATEARTSPTLGGKVWISVPYQLRTWGDYAVARVSGWDGVTYPPPGPPVLFVIQLSTFRAWKIAPRDSLAPNGRFFALDDEFLYIGGSPDPDAAQYNVTRITRYPLARLDDVGESLAR